jgi:hypothetical protein
VDGEYNMHADIFKEWCLVYLQIFALDAIASIWIWVRETFEVQHIFMKTVEAILLHEAGAR